MRRVALSTLLLAPCPAWAHGGAPDASSWETTAAFLVAASLLLGLVGFIRLMRRARRARPAILRRCALFAAGMQTMIAALIGPLPALALASFTAHMIEHELLMVVAAPLIILSRPGPALTLGVPAAARGSARALKRVAQTLEALRRPAVATVLHGLALWLWHIPVLFRAALEGAPVHALQHVSFFGSALLFWSALLPRRAPNPTARGVAALHLTVTSLHAGALGALLAMSGKPWFVEAGSAAYELSPLEDQQLGGVMMWVVGCSIYAAGAVALFGVWLAETATRPAAPISESPIQEILRPASPRTSQQAGEAM